MVTHRVLREQLARLNEFLVKSGWSTVFVDSGKMVFFVAREHGMYDASIVFTLREDMPDNVWYQTDEFVDHSVGIISAEQALQQINDYMLEV